MFVEFSHMKMSQQKAQIGLDERRTDASSFTLRFGPEAEELTGWTDATVNVRAATNHYCH